jgi:hypothetical protein
MTSDRKCHALTAQQSDEIPDIAATTPSDTKDIM